MTALESLEERIGKTGTVFAVVRSGAAEVRFHVGIGRRGVGVDYSLAVIAALLDALAFTSLWAAAVAGALCVAASLAMGVAPTFAVVGVAVSGTLVVYNIDRLRDLDRDFATSPVRSAFILRNVGAITILTVVSAAVACGCTLFVGWRAIVLLVPALVLGLFHRRLKTIPFAKPAYITMAWILVIVGLPVIVAPAAHIVPVAAILALSIAANVIASNVRDDEIASPFVTATMAMRVARGLAIAGVVAAIAGSRVLPLVAIPACTFAALLRSDVSERYGLIVVDGALLVGAIFAILLFSA